MQASRELLLRKRAAYVIARPDGGAAAWRTITYLQVSEEDAVSGPVDLREERPLYDAAHEIEQVGLDLVVGVIVEQIKKLRLPHFVVLNE